MRARAFWDRDGTWPRLLAPLAAAYDVVGPWRRALTVPSRAAVPVICVGNAVAGGAGKTPVVLALAERLAGRGRTAHLLGRGYGGRRRGPLRVDPAVHDARAVGDEALLLARAAPTWIARSRRRGLAAASFGAELVIVDDGLQNPTFVKDLSLLVVDGDYGFGNGRVLPAGPLREPAEDAVARADAVVMLGEDRRRTAALAIERGKPVLRAALVPTIDLGVFADRPVVAFAGIGRPGKFFATLRRAGIEPASCHAFADHHVLDEADVMAVIEDAAGRDARVLTTEKDWVRLAPGARGFAIPVPVAVAWENPQALDALLGRVLPA